MEKNIDQQVLELIKSVEKQKFEIQALEKPSYKTHCSWSYTEQSNTVLNLHTLQLKEVLNIASFLITKQKDYSNACKFHNVENPPCFTWCGFSFEDWQHDIGIRIQKIQIQSKKNKLETLENRLNNIVSPELKRKLELESILSEI